MTPICTRLGLNFVREMYALLSWNTSVISSIPLWQTSQQINPILSSENVRFLIILDDMNSRIAANVVFKL